MQLNDFFLKWTIYTLVLIPFPGLSELVCLTKNSNLQPNINYVQSFVAYNLS